LLASCKGGRSLSHFPSVVRLNECAMPATGGFFL
jgi:hypothetical protein